MAIIVCVHNFHRYGILHSIVFMNHFSCTHTHTLIHIIYTSSSIYCYYNFCFAYKFYDPWNENWLACFFLLLLSSCCVCVRFMVSMVVFLERSSVGFARQKKYIRRISIDIDKSQKMYSCLCACNWQMTYQSSKPSLIIFSLLFSFLPQ